MRLLALIAALLLVPVACFAEEGDGVTYLHDHMYNIDQTWSGVVEIDGVVQFDAGTTLTILPGTTVRFTRTDTDHDGIGENELYVQGKLLARGTKDAPIVFTSAEADPKPGDWGAVNIMVSEGETNVLENAVIEYAYRGFHMHFSHGKVIGCTMRYNFLGIQCQDSEMEVTGCNISHNRGAIVFKDSKLLIKDNVISDNYWGIRFLYGEVELTGNRITGNLVNGVTFRENKVTASGNVLSGNRKGFSADTAELTFSDNVVKGSVESGVYLMHSRGTFTGSVVSGNGDSGFSVEDSDVRISGNDITGNSLYGVDNNGSMDVNARSNWWGTPDEAAVAEMVYDRAEKPSRGRVQYSPVAKKAFTDAN